MGSKLGIGACILLGVLAGIAVGYSSRTLPHSASDAGVLELPEGPTPPPVADRRGDDLPPVADRQGDDRGSGIAPLVPLGLSWHRQEQVTSSAGVSVIDVFRMDALARALELSADETSLDVEFVMIVPGGAMVARARGFFIARTEVTRRVWHVLDGMAGQSARALPDAMLPAVFGTSEEAAAWCARSGLRLPTSAEWECAAAWPEMMLELESGAQATEFAWIYGNSGGRPHAVGELRPNAWGLYDVAGNVSEWCEARPEFPQAGTMFADYDVLRGSSSLSESARDVGDVLPWGPASRSSDSGVRPVFVTDAGDFERDPR